jgi:hypothetical protein
VKRSLTIQIAWGGSTYPWKSGPVLACIIVGFLALAAFALYGTYLPSGKIFAHAKDIIEIYVPLEQPMMPIKLLKNRNYVAVSCSACVGTMIYFSMNILWPQQVASLYETDQTAIGWLSVSTYHSNT